ncbi:MAG: serine/threonine protein kinase [Phycisphaerales bacterium]|nr:serine/threonine protein kinase [Phycisphaerales bacterium]
MQQKDASARFRLVESLYQQALDIPLDQRGRFLSSTCGKDAGLRREVEQLLDHYQSAGSGFLEQPVHAIRETHVEPNRIPSRIGQFRIIRLLGRGGMGAVFEAEQENPRRRVAIKVVRDDLFSSEFQRRFRREANLLAKLPHPGIAQIYEFGSASAWHGETEQPRQLYFAMELVEGQPITQFAEGHRLDVAERLELVARLCDAVQHAHQKGIVHRDLKPANILVRGGAGPGGGDGSSGSIAQPVILDFGVARVLETEEGGPTRTAAGELVGTIAYMSPEQLSDCAELIDTRSDVYSIGVIAYELLTGRLPIDLSGLTLVSAIRKRSESDTPRAGAIRADLRGDIEAILAKALEREPARRYPSTAELSADIRRCLRHEPVTARGQTPWYLLSRYARRNRGVVAGIAVAAVALVTGTGVAIASALRATQEARRAATEASRSVLVCDFLRQMLASASPRSLHLPDVTVRQTLDEAAAQIDAGALITEPDVEATVRTTIGETYLAVGRFDAALAQLEKALAIAVTDHQSDTARTIALRGLIARALCGLARFDESEQIYRETIESAKQVHTSAQLLAEMICDFGNCLFQAGKLDTARETHEAALAELDRSNDAQPVVRARITMELGRDWQELGNFANAEPLLRAALALYRENLPAGHPDIAFSLNRVGWFLFRRHGYDSTESETMLREALAIYRKTLDPGNPELANCLNNLGMRIKKGRNPEAIALLREALQIRETALGPHNPDVAESLMHLAHALTGYDDAEAVRQLSHRALAIYRDAFGETHQQFAFALHDVAVFHLARDDAERAAPLLRECLAILIHRLGEEHDLVAHVRDSLGVALLTLGENEEALQLLESALAARRRVLDPRHMKIAISLGNVAQARLRNGDVDGAIDATDNVIDMFKSDPGEQARFARVTLVRAEALLTRGSAFPDQITEDITEAITILESQYGEFSWQTANALRVMTLNWIRRGDLDEARAEFAHCKAVLDCLDHSTRQFEQLNALTNALTDHLIEP